jgi:hypothetical protein
VCDVDDEDTVAAALLTGDFEPLDAEDQPKAADLLMALGGQAGAPGDDDVDADDDDDVNPEALPVEANTPPAPAAAAPTAARKTAKARQA